MVRWRREVVLLLLLLCSVCGRYYTADGAAPQAEVDIVAQFFQATRFQNTTAVTISNLCTGWPAMLSCTFDDHVSSLSFENAKLVGSIPTGLCGLAFLSSLCVSRNQLSGSIPSDLGRCSSMMKIQMAMNLLSGSLPDELSNCTLLNTFDVSYNNFTGTIPAAYSAWGTSITTFDVSVNNLVGTLPTEFSSWKKVTHFAVNRNQLSGTLPMAYSDMYVVSYFDVNTNYLSGALPDAYQRLRQMQSFSCSNNMMSGTLPTSFALWDQIGLFRVDGNYFSGTIPAEYSAWYRINYFNVGSNSFTGSLPPEFANWTTIATFYANNIFLSGILPSQYGTSWKSVTIMTVQNNSFTGSLPAEYSALTMLTTFNVASNLMTGTLPPQYAAWSKVWQLYLFSNAFTGPIPSTWGMGMTSLQLLSAFNNMLSGTIPAMKSPLFTTFAISFNDFSGSLPTPTSWSNLTLLDIQNNSKLVGPITLPTKTFMVSCCGTQLCINKPLVALQLCLPSGVIAGAINSALATILPLVALYSYSTVSCDATTTLPPPFPPTTLQPLSNETSAGNQSTEADDDQRTAASGAVATVMVLGAALGAVDAADAQMLVSILGSPCVCSSTLTPQQREGSLLMFALSPFSPLGPAWAALGNSLLCCVLVGLHIVITSMLARRCERCVPSKVSQGNTLLGRFLHDSNKCTRRRMFARLRFPNLSVTLIMLLVPGVVRASVSAAGVVFSPFQSSDSLEMTAFPVGIVFVLFAACFVEVLVYRHVDAESTKISPSSSQRGSVNLRFSLYRHPLHFSKVVPAAVSAMALPRGLWEPPQSRASYGGVVSAYVSEWRRAWVVLPLANVIVQVLNGIDGSGSTCDALQGLTMCVLACVCAFIAYARPHRALLASYLVCASLVLTMATALLGLLCRHGAVSEDAVSGFGVFASVAMFVFKLYHVLMRFVEHRLLHSQLMSMSQVDKNPEERTKKFLTQTDVLRTQRNSTGPSESPDANLLSLTIANQFRAPPLMSTADANLRKLILMIIQMKML